MARGTIHHQRGCLIGNLGQEMGSLPPRIHAQLGGVFADWQARVAYCLLEDRSGEISLAVSIARISPHFSGLVGRGWCCGPSLSAHQKLSIFFTWFFCWRDIALIFLPIIRRWV